MALISDIPTITATQASALESVTLFTLDDLLRTERGALVRRLPQITLTEIRGWQAIAELSQLDTITVAEAAALQAAGVSGIDEFSDWDLARLRPILAQRDDEQLLALVTSANIACGAHAGDAESILRECSDVSSSCRLVLVA